jgi:glucose-6-phosphate 1-epimerase
MKLSKNIKISKNKDGLEFIEIKNSQAEARIALQGAHVDWWKPNTIKDDVLWISSNARYEGRKIN